MALILEDGTGVSTANSYADSTYADAYFSEHLYYSEAWAAYTSAQKDNALMAASLLLDNSYDWEGTKTVETSGLRWPRTGVLNLDGIPMPEDVLPSGLQKATCELAAELLVEDRMAAADSTGIEEIKVDVIELKFDSNSLKPVITSRVKTFLRGLGTSTMGSRVVKVFRS